MRIRRGIFNTNETSIPYRQIQDVDLVQSLINKIIGVTRIAILTAGHEDKSGDTDLDFSEATLPAIDYADALVIRESLLSKANVQKVIVS